MILVRYTSEGLRRVTDLRNIYNGRTAFLVGGAPSLLEQPIHLLEQRGVLSMAMNNAAQHVRSTMWCCGDHPECFQPAILYDPTILKIAPTCYAETPTKYCGDKKFREFPNTFFYIQEAGLPWDEFFADRAVVPWYNNTMFVSIHVLYALGIRRIILAGSDFGFGKNGEMYAHATKFGSLERKWNLNLYNNLVKELRLMKPIFDGAGLQLYDSSKNSRLGSVYPRISMEDGVKLCLEDFPSFMDSAELPHCSKFAPTNIKDAIAGWPGHKESMTRIRHTATEPQPADSKRNKELQEVL